MDVATDQKTTRDALALDELEDLVTFMAIRVPVVLLPVFLIVPYHACGQSLERRGALFQTGTEPFPLLFDRAGWLGLVDPTASGSTKPPGIQ